MICYNLVNFFFYPPLKLCANLERSSFDATFHSSRNLCMFIYLHSYNKELISIDIHWTNINWYTKSSSYPLSRNFRNGSSWKYLLNRWITNVGTRGLPPNSIPFPLLSVLIFPLPTRHALKTQLYTNSMVKLVRDGRARRRVVRIIPNDYCSQLRLFWR